MKPVEIDYERLSAICMMEQEEFFNFGVVHKVIRKGAIGYRSTYNKETKVTTREPYTAPDEESFYIFQDNGAKILAVVHLDTVIETWENWTFEKATLTLGNNRNKKTFTKLWNPQLDDRLGAYILMDLLPKFLGAGAYDILFTTDEEISQTTAANFELPEGKEYNWIFQFDRRGTGAVLYQYDDAEWRKTVNEFLPVQTGTFSDIGKLDWIGCKALNVGTGYHDEHSDYCYMIEEEVTTQVKNFIRFFNHNKDTYFPHVRTVRPTPSYGRYAGGWDDDGWTEEDWWKGDSGTGYNSFRTSTPETRYPPTDTTSMALPRLPSPLVTGAPRTIGITRLGSKQDSLDSDEILDESEYEDRDGYADLNDRKMINHVLQSMTAYDKNGNYVGLRSRDDDMTDLNLISSELYYSADPENWVQLPAVRKINTVFQFDSLPTGVVYPPVLTPIYHNPITGAQALYCKGCSACIDLDEVYWSQDAIPVCADCVHTFPAGTVLESALPNVLTQDVDEAYEVPLTPDQLRWLGEGGGIRTGKRTIRTFTGVDKHITRCYCDLCNEAEWADKMVKFTNEAFTGGDQCVVCRPCFDLYQDEGVSEGDKAF